MEEGETLIDPADALFLIEESDHEQEGADAYGVGYGVWMWEERGDGWPYFRDDPGNVVDLGEPGSGFTVWRLDHE